MNDKELLELAAKAAGYSHLKYLDHQCKDGQLVTGHYEPLSESCINPLTDDGDALRLAVKLMMEISITDGHAWAIVRAAAEIAKAT